MDRSDKRIRDFGQRYVSRVEEREIRFHAAASLNLTNRFGLRKRVLEHTRISPKTKGIRRNIFPSPPPPIYPAGIANQSAKREGRGSDRKGKSAIPR